MAQTKFDKQVEETAESLMFGIGRFLAGRPMDGVKRTDATFWRSGTRVLPKVEGRVSRSSYRAGWKRLTFRISALAAAGAGGYQAGWVHQDATVATAQEIWADPDPAIAALEQTGIAAASTAAVGTAAYLALTRKRRELMREWVLPLHEALALPLRLPEQTDPRRYLHIPRNFSEDDAVIRVDVPGRLDFSKDLVVDIITTKLALEGVTFSWHLAGRETYVTVKKTRKPPAKAAFKDPKVREIVAAAKESVPVIGIGSAGRIVTVDLDAESPHILVNASTGGGKSVTLRCIACQMLHHGSRVFVLDTKRISHPWASGLPGVTYCRDIADIHDQLIALGMEGRRRTRVADELGIDADPKAIGHPLENTRFTRTSTEKEHRTMLWNKNKSTLPELLRLTDTGLHEQLAAMPASQVLIGLGADGQPVTIDWDTESPHILVCSASGGGTSTILRTLAMLLDRNVKSDDAFFDLLRFLSTKALERDPARLGELAQALAEEAAARVG
ncbi:helicase HerA domain-containing protein [Streptomyces sp. NPDC087437]|uniref:helicase HerA domain-containing protein n=1 Tax=Streptomyces sp. NPDC087437 TaxID=3365789 RepID=UPI0038294F66